MHADTIAEHETMTAVARDIVHAWRGTDPMHTEDDVRQAMTAADVPTDQLEGLLPYVVDACLEAGLLVGGEEVQRVGQETARAGVNLAR